MPKLLILLLTPLLLSSYNPSTAPEKDPYADSSSSRGCPVSLPTLRIDRTTLPNQVKFRLVNSKQQHPIMMSIYTVERRGKLSWYHEGQASKSWETLTIALTPDQEYELTGVVPCKGDTSAGQVVRVRF
ncbi:MAG: hypothetical protein AB4058_16525 [Microcystaceae cyanobacterium]